jgi:CHAT domain-containing protein
MRAGLVFAGANERRKTNDGILPANEAAWLDLAGTQLVVLSACETGVGRVNSGDGLQGMQRALLWAGARALVMSLWKVDDDATRDLMVGFYEGLKRKRPGADALRDAQLQML